MAGGETRTRAFRDQYERATSAYNAKDYAAAIPLLRGAFAIEPVPQILFNIAQAYRRLHQFNSARVYYELYQSLVKDLTPEREAALQQHIREMDERELEVRASKILTMERTRLLYVEVARPPPAWLQPAGIATSLAGLGMLGAGATLLALDGRCTLMVVTDPGCERIFASRTPGIALTVLGGAVLLLGVLPLGLSSRGPSQPVVRKVEISDEPLLPLPQAPSPAAPVSPEEPPPAGWVSESAETKPL